MAESNLNNLTPKNSKKTAEVITNANQDFQIANY
jgi:hypothetical protein